MKKISIEKLISVEKFQNVIQWMYRIRNKRLKPDDLSLNTLQKIYSAIGKLRIVLHNENNERKTYTYLNGDFKLANIYIGFKESFRNSDEIYNFQQRNSSANIISIVSSLYLGSLSYDGALKSLPTESEVACWAECNEEYDAICRLDYTAADAPLYIERIPMEKLISPNSFIELLQWIKRIREEIPKSGDLEKNTLISMYNAIGKIRIIIGDVLYSNRTTGYITGDYLKANIYIGANKEFENPRMIYQFWQQNNNDSIYLITENFSLPTNPKTILDNLPTQTEIEKWSECCEGYEQIYTAMNEDAGIFFHFSGDSGRSFSC